MDKLHEEKLESQKHRNELNRWKIIVVSTLSAIGLGLTGDISKDNQVFISPQLVLCLIPLLCAYIDLLYFHDGLIINVIASFVRLKSPREDSVSQTAGNSSDDKLLMVEYELFTKVVRKIIHGPEPKKWTDAVGSWLSRFRNVIREFPIALSFWVLGLAISFAIFVGLGLVTLNFCNSIAEFYSQDALRIIVGTSFVIVFALVFIFSAVDYSIRVASDYRSVYFLGHLSTFWSSLIISFLVATYPFVFTDRSTTCVPYAILPSVPILVSGLLGVLWTLTINRLYKERRDAIRKEATGLEAKLSGDKSLIQVLNDRSQELDPQSKNESFQSGEVLTNAPK